MGDPRLVAVAALALSLGVSAIRLVHWFIHSDPKAVVRVARWAVIGLAVLSVPLLLVLLLNQQWAAAIRLASVMVLVLAWYGPRLAQGPLRLLDLAPERTAPAAQPAEFALSGSAMASRPASGRGIGGVSASDRHPRYAGQGEAAGREWVCQWEFKGEWS
jgi:hypothetical protein